MTARDIMQTWEAPKHREAYILHNALFSRCTSVQGVVTKILAAPWSMNYDPDRVKDCAFDP